MSSQKKYKIIATFMLLVFSLNMVAGFACSIGLNLGYNRHHHHDDEMISHQSHKHCLHPAAHHEHSQMGSDDLIVKAKDDDCCSGAVTKFAQLDKSIINNQFDLRAPVFLLAIISQFFYTSQKDKLFQLLSGYYNIKDALVAGNTSLTSAKAEEYLKTLNSIDYKIISEGNINALLKDASAISESKDIKKQRDYFANFSNNMATLAKSVKLSAQPIYQAYCPMKKVNWLSSDKTIKNPYFGTSMLSCGKIT